MNRLYEFLNDTMGVESTITNEFSTRYVIKGYSLEVKFLEDDKIEVFLAYKKTGKRKYERSIESRQFSLSGDFSLFYDRGTLRMYELGPDGHMHTGKSNRFS